MSLLYQSGLPKSRGNNRQNYIGNSVNRRIDPNPVTNNYNNYYGAPSLSKDYKQTGSSGTYLSHLSSNSKEAGLLPKLSHNIDKKEEDRRRNMYLRENTSKRDENHITPSLVQSEMRPYGDSSKNQLTRNKDSEPTISYLKQMPE